MKTGAFLYPLTLQEGGEHSFSVSLLGEMNSSHIFRRTGRTTGALVPGWQNVLAKALHCSPEKEKLTPWSAPRTTANLPGPAMRSPSLFRGSREPQFSRDVSDGALVMAVTLMCSAHGLRRMVALDKATSPLDWKCYAAIRVSVKSIEPEDADGARAPSTATELYTEHGFGKTVLWVSLVGRCKSFQHSHPS